MNNRMHTYTRKKHEYAYIYILAKNRTYWTHPPYKPSNRVALQACPIVCPIIYWERGENNRKGHRALARNSTQKTGLYIYEVRITRK